MTMKLKKPPEHLVWRISENTPMGEWVPKGTPRQGTQLERPGAESWASSTFDLLNGADAVEVTESVSGELFDELFPDVGSKDSHE